MDGWEAPIVTRVFGAMESWLQMLVGVAVVCFISPTPQATRIPTSGHSLSAESWPSCKSS